MESTDSIESVFAAIETSHGGLDIAVLNAAATAFKPLMEAEVRHLRRTYFFAMCGRWMDEGARATLAEGGLSSPDAAGPSARV